MSKFSRGLCPRTPANALGEPSSLTAPHSRIFCPPTPLIYLLVMMSMFFQSNVIDGQDFPHEDHIFPGCSRLIVQSYPGCQTSCPYMVSHCRFYFQNSIENYQCVTLPILCSKQRRKLSMCHIADFMFKTA